MKKRLIILSDLNGKQNSDWENEYLQRLKTNFEVHYYDCRELAGIDTKLKEEAQLHSLFINGGIESAIKKLIILEKGEVTILAFSIGGTIAWKAGLDGLKIKSLFAISSTRLRFESKKPNCNLTCTFGELDPFKPEKNWFKQMAIKNEIEANRTHDVYKKTKHIIKIVDKLIDSSYQA